MKKISLVTLLALSVGAQAAVEFDGMGRVRSTATENYDFDKDGKDVKQSTSYRFQMGMRASQTEDTSVYFQARFNKVAGETESGTTQTSGALSDPDGFQAHQAYIDHKFSDRVSMRAGRQELNYGDQLILGGVGFHNVGRSFDGWKFGYTSKLGTTDLLMMTIKEIGTETDGDRDHDLKGFYHSGTFGSVKNVDLYHLIDEDRTDKMGDNEKSITSTGVRLKSAVNAFDYRVEYTSQTVKDGDESESASQHDVELGYTFGKVRLAVENSSASEFYEQMYPTAHKWMGYADLYKRQNINQTAVHVGYKHNEKMNVKLSYHMFAAAEKTGSSHAWLATATEDATEDALGNEIDLTVNYNLGKGLDLQAVYATFAPGSRYAANDDALTFSYLQLTSKF